MDPFSTVMFLFQGLSGVKDLYSFFKKVRKPSQGSKYDLTTPFEYSNPLQMHYANLFHMAHLHSPHGFSPFVTGYPAGFSPAHPMAPPDPSFHQAHCYQQPHTSSNLFTEHFPTISRMFSSPGSSGSSHHSRQNFRSASFPCSSYQPPSAGFSETASKIQLIKQQEAGDTYIDDGIGMSTGGTPYYTNEDAIAHWNLFKKSGHGVSAHNSTMAVLDWTARLVTMYIRSGSKYYRNYRVTQVDVASFANTFQHNEVCSGIIRSQQLEAINKHISLIPDPRLYRFVSNNCWTFLGLPCPRETLDELGPAFLEAPRGVVFGIVNCLYTAPHRLNVDMKRLDHNLDCIHIDCLGPESALGRNPASDCAFTVFEFATNGWAHEKTLVG